MTLSRTSPSRGLGSPVVHGFYDEATGSIQYLAACPATRKAALIDVVAGYDPAAAKIDHDGAEAILRFAKAEGYEIEWVLDTHPHADHLMASAWLAQKTGAPNAIGAKITELAEVYRDVYGMPDAFDPARDFARLFEDGESFRLGEIEVRVMLSPGHTPISISYVMGDAIFAHDTFMQPDAGTARADFPDGDAGQLHDSLMAILDHDDDTRVFIGHDYGSVHRRSPEWEATVADHRRHNKHVGGGVPKDAFVETREARDKTLGLPDRMLHVIQMNLRAGRPPEAEGDGGRYLRIPLGGLPD